jgi:glutaredoxin-related protein
MLVTIKEVIEKNQIAVFMKGTPAQPKCGFSAAVGTSSTG